MQMQMRSVHGDFGRKNKNHWVEKDVMAMAMAMAMAKEEVRMHLGVHAVCITVAASADDIGKPLGHACLSGCGGD